MLFFPTIKERKITCVVKRLEQGTPYPELRKNQKVVESYLPTLCLGGSIAPATTETFFQSSFPLTQ